MIRQRGKRGYGPLPAMLTVALLTCAIFIGMGLMQAVGQDGDSQPPTPPANVSATAGTASPVITHLRWDPSSDNVAVAGYTIWRSDTAGGPYQSVATTDSTVFDDTSGFPGRAYWYTITAADPSGNVSGQSDIAGPVSATWHTSPHGPYPADTDVCAMCHTSHTALAEDLQRVQGGLCFNCHDGQGAQSNVLDSPRDSFALASGHSLEETTNADLTNTCGSCHDPHRDPSQYEKLPSMVVNGSRLATYGTEWCIACHDDSNSWYDGTYPTSDHLVRDAKGYPVLGTFSGPTVYRAPASAHARIPESTQTVDGADQRRSEGDCLYCHAAHRGANAYDGLLDSYRPPSQSTLASDQAEGSYAALCFECHGGTIPAGFTTPTVDIRQFVTAPSPRAGHRIVSSGGTLVPGSPLPCYDCHDSHGTKRGNKSGLSDELGQDLDTSTPSGVRQFCFTCHTSGDSTPMSWDSSAAAYVAASPADKVEGLSRVSGALLLPSGQAGHAQADTQSCYECHGDSYAVGGNNVHNPAVATGGMSTGGQPCYTCHTTFQLYMEDNLGTKLGLFNNQSYHHVLGSSMFEGDEPFAFGSYPGPGADVYCLSCHVDHDKFNDNRGANLRSDTSPSSEGTNTDFVAPNGGICMGCHLLEIPKDVANLKPGSSPMAPAIDGAKYAASAHSYVATSTFSGGSTFNANCSKCHNDEQPKRFQIGVPQFGTHFSAWDYVLGLTGVQVPGWTGTIPANDCVKCHGGGGSTDYYGVTPMSATATSVWDELMLGGSSHPIGAAPGVHRSDETTAVTRHVECGDCHNVHSVQPGTHTPQVSGSMAAPVIWGVAGYEPTMTAFGAFDAAAQYNFDTANQANAPSEFTRSTISSSTPEAYLCFRCHSKALAPANWPTSVATKSGTYAPTDVAAEFSPSNASGHNVLGAATQWPRSDFGTVAGRAGVTWNLPPNPSTWLRPGWDTSGTASMVSCSDCHANSGASQASGPHGASAKWLLDSNVNGQPTGDFANAYLGSTGIVGNPICSKCHESDTSILGATNSVHGSSKHQGATNGKCVNCHTRVPHAWKRPRMLAYTSDPAPYGSAALHGVVVEPGNIPGGGVSWGESDCSSTCHSGISGTVWP